MARIVVTSRLPSFVRLAVPIALLAGVALAGGALADHPDDLPRIADRIAGGAILLREVEPAGGTRDFQERAVRFRELVQRGAPSKSLRGEWQKLQRAFEAVQRSRRWRSDPRLDFLVSHLAEDVAAGARVVGAAATPARPERMVLLREEVCVGTQPLGPRPCPRPRNELRFRVPEHVVSIRRLIGEWRDYGLPAKAQVLLNGQAVWQTDVAKDWDADGRNVDLRPPAGSVLTVRSLNGEPFWIRRFEIDAVDAGTGR